MSQVMKEGYDQYWLTHLDHYDRQEEAWIMHQEQKKLSNDFLERQNSRWRWLTKEEADALQNV